MKKKLLLFLILFIFVFLSFHSKIYAGLCFSDGNCADNEKCNNFSCQTLDCSGTAPYNLGDGSICDPNQSRYACYADMHTSNHQCVANGYCNGSAFRVCSQMCGAECDYSFYGSSCTGASGTTSCLSCESCRFPNICQRYGGTCFTYPRTPAPGLGLGNSPYDWQCGNPDSTGDQVCYTPNCTSNPQSCGACGGGLGYNQCGTVNSTKSCTLTGGSFSCAPKQANISCSYFDNNCDGGQGYTCRNGNSCQRNCNTGTTACQTCGGGSQPKNTCNLNGTNPGTQTCDHNTWNGQNGCNAQAFTHACTYSYNNCSGAYTCTNNNSCQTTISGNIWKDYDHDGTDDGVSEPGYTGITVHSSSGATTTTDANGNYTLSGFTQGTYNVWYDLPSGYRATTTSPLSVTLSPVAGTRATGINFGITPLYTITGAVYNDVNINKYYNAGVDSIHNGDSVTITGNGYNQTINAGSFTTTQTLSSGEYHIVYNGPTTGWKIVYPGPPAELYVRVGLPGSSDVNHVCSNESYHDATCDASGNISGANIGITNENSWLQGVCTDLRIDGTITNNGSTSNGFIDPIPQLPTSGITCGGGASNGTNDSSYAIGQGTENITGGGSLTCTNPGIVFSGASVPDYGNGHASTDPYNWSLGGGAPLTESFTPVNPTIIRTSYAYMTTTAKESGIDLTTASHDITPYCTGGLNNCTLSSSLPDNVYLVNGNFYLNTYDFPAAKNIVIIVNGDLHIQGNIAVPVGSTATFSVSGDIYIDPSVGTTATDITPNVEGMFSADKSFIIQSSSVVGSTCNADGTPKDLRLNVQGSVVTNAAGAGGGFVNQRDLCVSDLACPTYQITQRPDFLLNAPDFIKHKNFVWQEQAP